jgi:hypothetical protein
LKSCILFEVDDLNTSGKWQWLALKHFCAGVESGQIYCAFTGGKAFGNFLFKSAAVNRQQ